MLNDNSTKVSAVFIGEAGLTTIIDGNGEAVEIDDPRAEQYNTLLRSSVKHAPFPVVQLTNISDDNQKISHGFAEPGLIVPSQVEGVVEVIGVEGERFACE